MIECRLSAHPDHAAPDLYRHEHDVGNVTLAVVMVVRQPDRVQSLMTCIPLLATEQLVQRATRQGCSPSMKAPASLLPSLDVRLSIHGPHGAFPVARMT